LKGVVLAGGLGTRLRPLTSVTNKHLLPVYNQPMIYYPIQTLVNAGITDIMVVTGGSSAGDFLRLLGNGKAFGLKHLNYAYQEGEGGIADALSLVEHFVAGGPVCVVLGDNIIEGNIRSAVEAYQTTGKWREDHFEESSRSATFWCAASRRQSRRSYRREACVATVRLRSHRHLHVRRIGLRHHSISETVGPWRARNHGR
jgi:choline kinase